MSATAITLADAQATPVDHVFTPNARLADGTMIWEELGGVPLGSYKLTAQLVRPPVAGQGVSARDRVSRIKIGIHTPILETLGTSDSGLTPAPQVAYIPRFVGEFIFSERSSLQERKNVRKFAYNALNESQLKSMVEDLINVLG